MKVCSMQMDQSGKIHPIKIIGESDSDTDDCPVDLQSSTKTAQADQKQEEIEQTNQQSEKIIKKGEKQVMFTENADIPAIKDLLGNCRVFKEELLIGGNLEGAFEEYEHLLKIAKETDCPRQRKKRKVPPCDLDSVPDDNKTEAPSLWAVLSAVSKMISNYKRWTEVASEYVTLTTLSQSRVRSSENKRQQPFIDSQSKRPRKSYENIIEWLLDQDWGSDRAPGPNVVNECRHLFTCQGVLKSTFPEEADIFALVDSTIKDPNDVPPKLRHSALFHFLLSVDERKYGIEISEIWRDFGRLVFAEKMLDLSKKAKGPDLHQNVIIKRLDYNNMQNQMKEKEDEIEELSMRLSKFASQQLTEGNPNIADLSDTHRPTRLGEMYSQLFDDEWSEAFDALKPKTEDDDGDVLPDTLYVLQNILTNVFEYCKEQLKRQMIYLENSFAVSLGFEEPKREDVTTERQTEISNDVPISEKKEQTEALGDTKNTDNEEEHWKKNKREADGGSVSSGQLSTQPTAQENPNKFEAENEQEKKCDERKVMTTLEHAYDNSQQILPSNKDPNTDNETNTTETNQGSSNQKQNDIKQETLDDENCPTRKQNQKAEPDVVKPEEDRMYRKSLEYRIIARHARDFSKAVASTTAKTKSKLFIDTKLSALIPDEITRADVRVLTYVRKCVELCWYMCMQDPPMVIVSPKRGQLVDKALFSFHGRRGKIVEVCVWPALLLNEEGPLVCKGYVLPEERNRN